MSVTEVGSGRRSYYGRPVIQEPVWKWEIPAYLFTGGLGGASSVLSLVARWSGHDRLKGGHEPACAKACPTESIQFGPLDELRDRAEQRRETLEAEEWNGARLYGHDPEDGVGGFGAFFLLLDEPEVYGLPPDPVVTTRDLPQIWRSAALAAGALFVGVVAAVAGGSQ